MVSMPHKNTQVLWVEIYNLAIILLYLNCNAAPHIFQNFRRVMRIPNMCLVMKLDNGKVVSIANEQNHRQTESQKHPVRY